MDLVKEPEAVCDYMVELRRAFHQWPEPSLKEYKTSERIRKELDKMGIPNKITADTGVCARIGQGEKTLALRADMDALCLTEQTGKPYRSQNAGVMHACGHDAHMAALLGAARILKAHEEELDCEVRLLFQPSEENCLGAGRMIAAGCLEGVSAIFGLHVFADMPCGRVSLEPGPRMAASGNFRITLHGKTGHAGKPQQCVDATLAGAALVMNLQSIISRELDPNGSAVVTVGRFVSGSQNNIISGQAELEGTVRTFCREDERSIEESIRRIAESTARTYRAEAEVDFRPSMHPEVQNDPVLTEKLLQTAKQYLPREMLVEVPKLFLGEDFSLYQEKIPGVFAFVGAGNEACRYPNHHERFDIDERALVTCARLHLLFVSVLI